MSREEEEMILELLLLCDSRYMVSLFCIITTNIQNNQFALIPKLN